MALTTDFLPFIFGGNTGETAESIAKKRQVAEALLARGGMPHNVGEGLTSVGNALASVILSRRAAAAEKEGQAGAGDIFSEFEKALLGGGAGGGGGDVTGATPSAAPGVAPPTPAWSPRNPPPATENVPAGWSAGGSFAPPAGAPAAQPTNLAGGADPTQFIAGLEGFSPKATWDVRQHSIGYGTRATPQEVAGQPITREEAQRRLGIETGKAANYVDSVIKVPLTPNQKTALTSLAYNVGSFGQGLINAINSGDAAGVGAWMAKYGVSDPRYAKGVGARRQKEIDLWNAGGGAPTQVASLDPSIGLPPAPTAVQNVAGALPGGGPPAPSPGVATVASALQGGGGAPAGPEMASAAPFPMGGASGLAPPFVPPSVPTGIQSGRPPPMMPTQALSPSAPPPRPAGAPPPAMGGGVSEAARQKALEVLNHPFSNAVQKAQALEVLKMAQQQRDPTYQMGLEKQRLEIDALRNKPPPAPETHEVGGILYERQKDGSLKPVTPVAGPDWRDATPDEIKAMHLPENTPLQVNTKTGQKAVPSGLAGGLFGGGAIDSDIVSNIADGVASGQIPPDMKSYYKYLVPVTAELQARGVNLSQLRSDWTATQRHYQTLENPQQIRIRQNIETIQHTFPVIRKLAEEWRAGGYPLLNEATRKAAQQGLLGPDANRIVTLLGAQVADVTSEMSSILMGGNSPTDHAMELAGKNLSEDWSYPTLIAALDQLEQNVKFRANAIRDVSTVGTSSGLYDYTKPPPATPATPAPAVPPPFPGAPTPGPYFGPLGGGGAPSPSPTPLPSPLPTPPRTVDDLIKQYAP